VTDASVGEIYGDKARNEACDPFVCFDFNKILDPYAIIHVLKPLVAHGTAAAYEALQAVGEVIFVRKIHILALENCPHSLYINLVFGCLG